jgi:hypothetical protein
VDVGIILDIVILAVLAVGGLVWRSFSSGVEQAAKDQATEIVSRINWSAVLGRELEKIRGTERQELRFTSYGLCGQRCARWGIKASSRARQGA